MQYLWLTFLKQFFMNQAKALSHLILNKTKGNIYFNHCISTEYAVFKKTIIHPTKRKTFKKTYLN